MPTFDAIGMVVADMEATVAFYRLLGLEIPDTVEGEDHVEMTTRSGVRIMLDTEDLMRSIDPDWKSPTGRGRVALAFLCENPDAVDAVYQRLVAAGHGSVRAPFDAFWGQRYATVLDPDGNPVDLFAAAG